MSDTHGTVGSAGGQAKGPSEARSRLLLVVLSLAIGVGLGAFFAVRYWLDSGTDSGTPAPAEGARRAGQAPGDDPANEKIDRALRREQLLVAKALVEEFPENQNALYLMGLVYREQGNTVEAVASWNRSLQLGRASADVQGYLGEAALLKEDFKTAERCYKKALELQPLETEYREGLAKALMYEGRMDEAIPVLRGTTGLTAIGHRMMAEAYQQLEDYENARKSYEAAIKEEPTLAEAHYGLARTFLLLGRMAESRKHMDTFRELKSKSDDVGRHWRKAFDPLLVTRQSVAHTHTDVARVYLAQGNPGKAEQLLRKAVGLDPESVASRMEFAMVHLRRNRVGEALRLYEEVMALTPEDPLIHYNIGNIHARMGKFAAAEAAFRHVIDLSPDRADGYRALAALYVRVDRNLEEARELASRAVDVDPSAASWAALATACEKGGQLQEAVDAIQEAIRLEPSNPMYRRAFEQLQQRN